MKVFVETNFVLELALEQQEAPACDALVLLAEQGAIQLLLPAYSLVEPHETLTRRRLDRQALRKRISDELTQIARSAPFTQRVVESQDIINLLVDSEAYESKRIGVVSDRICAAGEVLPLNGAVLEYVGVFQLIYDLTPQDAVIYSSIRSRLQDDHSAPSCFISRNPEDFDDPELQMDLRKFNCKYFSSFPVALQYIKHAVGLTP